MLLLCEQGPLPCDLKKKKTKIQLELLIHEQL